MIKLENREVMGWDAAIRGMRNPMNSWEKSDSEPGCETVFRSHEFCRECDHAIDVHGNIVCGNGNTPGFVIGPCDHILMMKLAKAGSVHAKYRRMITVYVDITAPLYWWKEFDTYKVGTVANSCSTMHKIHEKEFTYDDFSCEHLYGNFLIDKPESEVDTDCYIIGELGDAVLPFDILHDVIDMLNKARERFLEAKTKPMKEESKRSGLMKKYWWQMIQLLPSSYNQKRTVMLNYEVLSNIYESRKNHKLDEWRELCKWIEQLPYSEIITGEVKE